MLAEMVDRYRSTARMGLVRLTGRRIHEEGHLHRKTAKVVLLIECHSHSSTSFVTGVSG
ncbi:hypothetical protein Hanom_Chr09g00818881 [Helianthus anomalus]